MDLERTLAEIEEAHTLYLSSDLTPEMFHRLMDHAPLLIAALKVVLAGRAVNRHWERDYEPTDMKWSDEAMELKFRADKAVAEFKALAEGE